MLLFMVFLFVGFVTPVRAEEVLFTQEEKEYLAETKVLRAASVDGVAPLHYKDSKGEIKGIAIQLLQEISEITGLTFEYQLYESAYEIPIQEFDLFLGASTAYAVQDLVLSTPYLESKTVLYYNKALNPNQLEDKIYAGIKGGILPEGISEGLTVYYDTREESMNAVNAGKADYGFGNAYSVAFYTLQNGYSNLFTIPNGKEDREYCIGVHEENKLLLSIINKSLAAIDPKRMDALILDVASQVDRKVTLSRIMDAYGKEIVALIAFVMLLLGYSAVSSTRTKNQYKMENRRYRLLSKLSNEYLFEYQVKTDVLEMADKLHRVIDLEHHEEEIKGLLKQSLQEPDNEMDENNSCTIKLPCNSGGDATFRVLFSRLRDGSGKTHSILGKLVDISEEEREKEQWIVKSQLDGLTGLYNAVTTKEAIIKSIGAKGAEKTDALLIIDCDSFKEINDTHGHLMGNTALKNISRGLRLTFRQSDIIGRIGGDEFCVYLHDIPSVDFVRVKCQQLAHSIKESGEGVPVGISVGIAELKEPTPYESLFQQADAALYRAKGRGGAQVAVYDPREYGKVDKSFERSSCDMDP